MAVEIATYPSELVPANIDQDTAMWEGGAQVNLIKGVLLATFGNVDAAVTASAAELNYVDVTTLGTAQASKALTVSATNTVDASGVTWTSLGTVTSITITSADINGGTWNGTIDGAWTAAGVTCADLGTVTTADIDGGTWTGTIDGAWTASGQTCADLGTITTCLLSYATITTADINGGSIDGVTIGNTTAPTVVDIDINGGTLDGTTINNSNIGITTPAAGTFTNLKATNTLGFDTGAGGTATQSSTRGSSVTENNSCGAITLVSAAGSTTWETFTVNNSYVDENSIIMVNQKSGTDLYEIHVTRVGSGIFDITFRTTGGTTTEQPVFNFAVLQGVVT